MNGRGVEVYVIKPQDFAEAQTAADLLKKGRTVVINLEGVELTVAQRSIDFIGGATYAINAVSFFQCRGDGENTEVCRVGQFLIQVFKFSMVISYETMHTLTYHTKTFLNDFFERAAYRHDFTHRLHAGANLA